MAKNAESTVLSTLQDLLIFQMASGGVPQAQIPRGRWVGHESGKPNRKTCKNG